MSRARLRVGVDGRVLAIPGIRGWTRYATNLLRVLSTRDDVELVVFAREAPCAEHLAGVRARVVRAELPREAIWNDWWLPRRLRAEGVDVFHALADRGLPCWKPCALVVTLHNSYERAHWRRLFATPKRRLWYWKHELVNARLADLVLTVSDTTREELIAQGVCAPEKLARVYLAPADEFRPDADAYDADVRRRHGLGRPYVLYVGAYDVHKNVDTLVQAFARAGLAEHDLVVVAAKTRTDEALRASWQRLGCAGRLRLVEAPAADLPALYRGAALFVNPSTWESFSFQLVEAMAAGVPLVASRRTAIPEIVGDAGLLFEPSSVAELAALMRLVVSDAGLQGELRARGLRRVRQFDWRRVADETVAAYRQAAGG
ncbi:MAG: glycosyltransferase family 4 protein [Candidatus Binatia bacterium]